MACLVCDKLMTTEECQANHISVGLVWYKKPAVEPLCLECTQHGSYTCDRCMIEHDLPVAGNLLDRDFKIDEPDRVWASDITYIPTDEGWLYL